MECSIPSAHPNSLGARANTSWYSISNCRAASAALGGHRSSPDRSNFSISSFCRSRIDIFGRSSPAMTSNFSRVVGLVNRPGSALAKTTRAIGRPFFKWKWAATSFLTTTATLLEPLAISVYVFCTVTPCGRVTSSAVKAWVITLAEQPINMVSVRAWMIVEVNASRVMSFFSRTTSLNSLGSISLFADSFRGL